MARFASEEVKAELIKVANQLIENGKGLLAADEGHPVVGARLEKVIYSVEPTGSSTSALDWSWIKWRKSIEIP